MLIAFNIVAYKTASENCDRALINQGQHRGATAIKKLITVLEEVPEDGAVNDLHTVLTAHLQATAATVVFPP